MRTRLPRLLLSAPALLALLLACSSSSPDAARDPGPDYSTPVTAGWSLVKNTQLSTGRHLVLELAGPAGGSGLGVALNLDLGADAGKAAWAPVAGTDLVANLRYDLGTGTPAVKAAATGGVLHLGVFAKGLAAPATAYTAPLLRVALDLNPGLAAGTTVTVIPTRADELTVNGLRPIGLTVGTIQAK